MSALAAGIALDLLIGDPLWLPHPIRAIGRLIAALEGRLRSGDEHPDQKRDPLRDLRCGIILWIAVVLITGGIAFLIMAVAAKLARVSFAGKVAFAAVEAIMIFYSLAAKSLRDETMKVYKALKSGGSDEKVPEDERLLSARKSLSMIVGRDTEALDEAGIIRASVETVSENTSDGVIAPLFYVFLGGPVLGFIYKAVNTMDSMLGYRNERYEYFGRMSALADDVANFIPSRISAVFMIAAAWMLRYDFREAARIWRRDRRKHKSPNSAQTESVCAGALRLRLGGNAFYGERLVKKPFIGDDDKKPETDDIKRAIRLMFGTESVCTVAIFTITGLILIFRLI